MSIDDSPAADSIAVQRSKRAERLLVPATFITTAGDSFQLTAATVLVFRAANTTLSVGWLFIAVSIPQVLFSLMFGRLADKLDRRMLSIAADGISAVSALALPLWLWLHGPATLGSYLTNFVLAVTAALFIPASSALVKERVLDSRVDHFNAGTYVVSAVLTYLIGPKAAVETGAEDAEEETDIEPVLPVAPPIKRLAVLFGNWSLGLLCANTLLAGVILHTFHKGPWLIGLSDALAGVGFLTGAAAYPKISQRIEGLHLAGLGMFGMLVLFCLQPINYVMLMICIPLSGFCFAQGRIASRTLLMRAAPNERAGRIFGGVNAVGLAGGIVANLVLSIYADHTRVPYAFWALAAVQGAILAGAYFSLIRPMAAVRAAQAKSAEVLEAAPA